MKTSLKKVVTLIALAAFAVSSYAASIKTYEKAPQIEANRALVQEQLGWVSPSADKSSWAKGGVDFASVFGTYSDPSLFEMRVVVLGANFGYEWTTLGVYNTYGFDKAMGGVMDGYHGYEGTESFFSFSGTDNVNSMLFGSSYLGGQTFELFNPNTSSQVFATTEQMVGTWYYTEVDGVRQLVYGDLKTLIVGFEDSAFKYDSDYNDVFYAIQIIPTQTTSTPNPSGQPLPGVMTSILTMGCVGALIRLKRRNRK